MDYAKLLVRQRYIQIYEYFVIFVIMIYGGRASVFTHAIDNWDDPVGLMLPILSVAYLGYIKGIMFNKKYLLLIIGFTIYFIASTLKFGEIHPRFFGIYLIKFSIAYTIMSALGFKFFKIYEDILYYLCIIGISFWIILNVMPETFIGFLRNFEFSNQGPGRENAGFNTIVFTVCNYAKMPDYILHFGSINIYKNAGFAWEPGAFATLINLGILLNLVRNRFKLENKKHLFVFGIALVTTFSTTGYSMFILLVLFYIYNQDFNTVVWLAPVAAAFSLVVFMLPFMSEKITSENKLTNEELVYLSAKHKISYQPQRFQSLEIDFIDFKNHPLIGYGGHNEAAWTEISGASIATISGIGELMSQFGIVGSLFFIVSLWLSSKQIINFYNIRGTIFPVLFVLFYGISYSIFAILIMCVWLLYMSNLLKAKVIQRYALYTVLQKKYS